MKSEMEYVVLDTGKSGAEYATVMRELSDRSQVEWNKMQEVECSSGVGFVHRYRNAYCDGKEDSWITKDLIEPGHGVCLDEQCYDAETLSQWLDRNPTLPHNRASMPPKNLQWLMKRPEPWPAMLPWRFRGSTAGKEFEDKGTVS